MLTLNMEEISSEKATFTKKNIMRLQISKGSPTCLILFSSFYINFYFGNKAAFVAIALSFINIHDFCFSLLCHNIGWRNSFAHSGLSRPFGVRQLSDWGQSWVGRPHRAFSRRQYSTSSRYERESIKKFGVSVVDFFFWKNPLLKSKTYTVHYNWK